jgi:hypothetical protein
MKKVLLLAGAMLAMSVAVASAQGINLNWDDCTLGAAAQNKVDPCNSNFGAPNKLIVSMDPGGVLDNVNGAQGTIDLQVSGGALVDYWRLGAAGCRAGRLSADVAVGSGNAPFSCPEPWASGGGNQSGGANFSPFIGGADRGRITWIVAIPGLTVLDGPSVAPDWYIIALNLLKTNTTTCAGCLQPACLVANEIRLTRPAQDPRGDVFVYNAAASQHVTWQSGTGLNCPGATPTQTNTWGQVKSLYR